MRFSISLIMAMVSVALVSESIRADHVRSLDELKQQMTQLGKPALVIAGADWCVHCREIAQELATVPELQPLKKQFAILKIDADTPLWAAARRAFKFEEKGVPAVFVFRADGKELHSGAGKPTDMEGFLKRNLQQAGLILTPVQAQILNKDLAKLERALKLKNLSEAIKISEPYDLGKSFAQSAISNHNDCCPETDQRTSDRKSEQPRTEVERNTRPFQCLLRIDDSQGKMYPLQNAHRSGSRGREVG